MASQMRLVLVPERADTYVWECVAWTMTPADAGMVENDGCDHASAVSCYMQHTPAGGASGGGTTCIDVVHVFRAYC